MIDLYPPAQQYKTMQCKGKKLNARQSIQIVIPIVKVLFIFSFLFHDEKEPLYTFTTWKRTWQIFMNHFAIFCIAWVQSPLVYKTRREKECFYEISCISSLPQIPICVIA